MTTGCFAPGTDADELHPGQEPGSLFAPDASSGSGSGACANATTLTSLHVKVRTTAVGGRYAPRNIGAMWIEDSTGKFIKTVELWAKTRARWLVKWNAASKGNVVDAITSATLSAHTTHDRTWNLTGLDKCRIAPGSYRVMVEETDSNMGGPTLQIPFTVDQPATLTPAETTTFHDLLVELK